ncbi:MAG TPA: 2-oxo-4-hydroxy-4-carboxy-5-ureidoimidazoline decarboxylase [Terracidiphilus sp.]|jgi:OHCU decarboxylase
MMNSVLDEWNKADEHAARDAMLACCAAQRWAAGMVALQPIANIGDLSEAADRVWATMSEPDWLEAFAAHPRIGERKAVSGSEKSAAWSRHEQAGAGSASADILRELAEGNAAYEQRFGFPYVVCATGKGASEMLAILKHRLPGERMAELKEAAEQQRQIMQIRLGKWLLS